MYQIGERLIYSSHGVCVLSALEERVIDRKKVLYYVLEPLDQTGTKFYVPTHNQNAVAKLRTVLSREALDALLHSEEILHDAWIPDENSRKQRYKELCVEGDRVSLLQMVITLHRQKQTQIAAGRKFHLCDENFLRDAQKMLHSEFSTVLGLSAKDTEKYILNMILKEHPVI